MLTYLVTILLATQILANDSYLVCKSISRIFNDETTTEENQATRCTQESPGARGPKGFQGIQGPPGPQGPPGVVNYTQINQNLQMELLEIKRKLQCVDGVVVDNICYKLPYRVGIDVNYNEANAICSFRGGELAEIPTRKAYDAIYSYVRDSWYYTINRENNFWIDVWLGYSYQYNADRRLRLRSGEIGYVHWDGAFPSTNREFTRILLRVKSKPGRISVGMFNHPPSYAHYNAVLCQFTLV